MKVPFSQRSINPVVIIWHWCFIYLSRITGSFHLEDTGNSCKENKNGLSCSQTSYKLIPNPQSVVSCKKFDYSVLSFVLFVYRGSPRFPVRARCWKILQQGAVARLLLSCCVQSCRGLALTSGSEDTSPSLQTGIGC